MIWGTLGSSFGGVFTSGSGFDVGGTSVGGVGISGISPHSIRDLIRT